MSFKPKSLIAAYLIGFAAVATPVYGQQESIASVEENQILPAWLGGELSIDNSVGIGTFVSGFARVPQWATTLTLSPQAYLPLPAGWPKTIVSADLGASIWWLDSIQTSALDNNHRVQFPDLVFTVSTPMIYEFEKIGVSFSAAVPIVAPISRSSLALNRVVAGGLNVGVKWKKGEFSVGYSPSARGWLHSSEAKTSDCFDSDTPALGVVNSKNPDFTIDQYMMSLAVFRDEESSDGSTCIVAGRQSLWTIKNSVSAGWANQSHHVSVGLTYYWNFLRPLEDRPELSGLFSSNQSFTQAVLGRIAYSYTLPLPVDMAVSTGIMSYQSVFSKMGAPLFPFFDFATPTKNQTQLFVEMVASI